MDEVEYSCPRCRRSIRAPRAQVLVLLNRKRTRCQVCGTELEFPADVKAEFDGAHKVGGKDVRDEVTYSCGCKRKYTRPLADVVQAISRGKTTCPICGKAYEFPAEVTDAYATLRAKGAVKNEAKHDCPTCGRAVRQTTTDPETVLACGMCGAKFRAPLGAEGFRAPPVEDAASPEEVAKVVASMPRDRAGKAAAAALVARAERGEVERGEAEELVLRHETLAAWRPEADASPPHLPVPYDEAETVVPAILFPGLTPQRDRSPDGVRELVFWMGNQTAMTAEGALNVLGVVTLFAAGRGTFFVGDGNTRDAQRRLRVSLTESRGGVDLGLSHQVDDGRPKRASAKELLALSARIVEVAPAIRNYYALLAVFGPWARGMPAVVASEATIGKRLASFGGEQGLAAELRVVLEKRKD